MANKTGHYIRHTEGNMWRSFVKSTQILTVPFGLGTTTIPEHYSVGFWTFIMTPTLQLSFHLGIAILLGVLRTNKFVSDFNLTWYSPSIVPKPENSCGNFSSMLLLYEVVSTVCIRATSPRAWIAGRPTNGFCSPSMMYTVSLVCSPFLALTNLQ